MAKARVLIIDDDRTILEMLKLALTRADLEVLSASDGDMGLRIFREQKPDLAIIDIAMPGIDGYDVVERIRASEPADQRTPIIILTAHEQSVMRNYAEELGVNLYLVKPVAPKVLINHILKQIGLEATE